MIRDFTKSMIRVGDTVKVQFRRDGFMVSASVVSRACVERVEPRKLFLVDTSLRSFMGGNVFILRPQDIQSIEPVVSREWNNINPPRGR